MGITIFFVKFFHVLDDLKPLFKRLMIMIYQLRAIISFKIMTWDFNKQTKRSQYKVDREGKIIL